jgi:uncharacterized protein (TIGR02271 family)
MSHERFSMTDDWELEDSSQDVRGRPVVDAAGTTIGTVTDMLVDPGTESIDAVVLDSGQELPMDALVIESDAVRYAEPGASGFAGGLDGDRMTSTDRSSGTERSSSAVAGDTWDTDAQSSSAAGTDAMASGTSTRGIDDDRRVELREEDLQARTRRAEAGEVVVDKRVVEERRSIDVPVTHEEVVIQRRPASGQGVGDAGDIGEQGDTIRVPVMAEQVEVTKQPRVVEELEISKRAVTENQRVSDTVRREEADIRDEGQVDVVDGGSTSGRSRSGVSSETSSR